MMDEVKVLKRRSVCIQRFVLISLMFAVVPSEARSGLYPNGLVLMSPTIVQLGRRVTK